VHRILTAIVVCSTLAGQVAAQSALLPRVSSRLTALQPDLIAFRRDLHRHPERSGEEVRTAGRIAARLRTIGLDVRTGIAGHGVVGILRGRLPGPVVAYRADMDAVASSDPDPVDFRSETPGVRHICGHDLHVTIALALADALHGVRTQLRGTIVFIFQPAEESVTGANAMLAAGVLASPAPVAIYGLHTAPLNVGQMGTIAGDLMSGHDTITLSGLGDLAGAARTVTQRLDAIATVRPDQMFTPGSRDLILVQQSSGTDSVGRVMLRGTIIATSVSRPRVIAEMQALRTLALPAVRMSVDYRPKAIAGVTNDAALTQRAMAAAAGALGAASVLPMEQIIPAFSEDFGSFQERVPGVFFFLGVSNPATGTRGMPHTADYVADEGAMQVGARAMAAVLLERLQR
jgi:metal-dependent amidase/aminoacylase/carboxypeptidase family protein